MGAVSSTRYCYTRRQSVSAPATHATGAYRGGLAPGRSYPHLHPTKQKGLGAMPRQRVLDNLGCTVRACELNEDAWGYFVLNEVK